MKKLKLYLTLDSILVCFHIEVTYTLSEFYETQVFIVGTKGSIKVCDPFFAPTKLIVNSKDNGEEVFEYPVDKGDRQWNFGER